MMKGLHWLLGISAVVFVIGLCSCNQMDPHVFPSKGPFFEGWYMRIVDQHAGVSVGWLFSRILTDTKPQSDFSHPCIQRSLSPVTAKCPEDFLRLRLKAKQADPSHESKSYSNASSHRIPYFINAILLINPTNESKLAAEVKYFPLEDYSITQDGRPISKNPDDATPPHFEAKIGNNVSFIVRPNGTKFSLQLGSTLIRGETDNPVPWGPHGEGPESWIDKLPLPLHWFVYSLRSRVLHYEVVDKNRGIVLNGRSKKGNPVVAHMEKNWGAAFPKAWVWAQGVDATTNISFAVSAGLLTELGIDIPAQLSNYRNPAKGIDCKFHPANSEHILDQDGCSGKAYLHVKGLFCQVVFELYTKPEFLSNCLTTPQVYGYTLGCVESYNAVANITVFQREGLKMVYTDSQTIKMSAIEFGGKYMCNVGAGFNKVAFNEKSTSTSSVEIPVWVLPLYPTSRIKKGCIQYNEIISSVPMTLLNPASIVQHNDMS